MNKAAVISFCKLVLIFDLGCVPNVQRAALVNLGDLTAYDQTKTFLVLRGLDPDSKVSIFKPQTNNMVSVI